ncbi:MAG: uracil-DNA glycosylase family protein, partial [Haloarculaceae archaeon]
DANAHFHVVGDHPGVHGGAESGYPFTGTEASERLQRALVEAGLLDAAGTPPTVDRTYLSYLYMCVPEGVPSADDYAALEPLFDAELRAITAHVVLPVGERATAYVLRNLTARSVDGTGVADLHATEVSTGGWLVCPVKDPAAWTDEDERALVDAVTAIRSRDYRRTADLGRFLPDDDPYLVR